MTQINEYANLVINKARGMNMEYANTVEGSEKKSKQGIISVFVKKN